jgi:SAM-dependent methyltransferase
VLLVSSDAMLAAAARAVCADTGKSFVDAALPPNDSREIALLQEVLHHDFELGGLNDWTGADPQFSAPVLRMLSAAHCRTSFPGYATAYVDALWQQNSGQPLQALDIGCGAISRLRWGALNGFLTVTGVDPLLDMYAIVRERHGYANLPAIRCAHEVIGGAEQLATALAPASFDLAFCSNALDHTEDPVVVVEGIARVVRPGGLVAIDVYTREGSRENWWQLHQFDMYINDRDEFVCETREGVVRNLVAPGSGLVVREIAAKDQTTALILERVGEPQLRKAG